MSRTTKLFCTCREVLYAWASLTAKRADKSYSGIHRPWVNTLSTRYVHGHTCVCVPVRLQAQEPTCVCLGHTLGQHRSIEV